MRQCPICHQGFEDEFHFVCVCPAYVHIRKKYIKQYYWKRPSMFELVHLFNTENRKALNGLAKYVYQAFNLRNEVTRTSKYAIPYPSCSFEIMHVNDWELLCEICCIRFLVEYLLLCCRCIEVINYCICILFDTYMPMCTLVRACGLKAVAKEFESWILNLL